MRRSSLKPVTGPSRGTPKEIYYLERTASGNMVQVGPVTLNDMREALVGGRISMWSMVATDDDENWKVLGETGELWKLVERAMEEHTTKEKVVGLLGSRKRTRTGTMLRKSLKASA
eukprot:TRINITY_DN16816_c0_g1_i1.p1 TRINITY_DN16816_c0_g1~~TRINITY_DN16816_c0_g1_i1.p1  ORF type:complete len:116 (+),score=25.53 TRINITY_DN16816_c0_g1_i1:67-414(+)